MKRTTTLAFMMFLLTTPLFATYVVVLKDGTRYRAREKWTVSGGKALVVLESGQTLSLDAGLIDVATSNEINRLGLGDVNVISAATAAPETRRESSSLGSITKLKKPEPARGAASTSAASRPPTPAEHASAGEAIGKFVAAFENIGLFDASVRAEGPDRLRVEVTTDNEEQVFKAISATSYMLVRVPGQTRTPINTVELFMKTINGGSAGRFQMSIEDAKSIDTRAVAIPDYFVRKVIY